MTTEKERIIVNVPVVRRVDLSATLRSIPRGTTALFEAGEFTYNFPSVKAIASKLTANGEGIFHVEYDGPNAMYTITRE